MAIGIDVAEGRFVGDDNYDRFAALIGLADVDDPDPRRFGCERAVILQHVRVVTEDLWGADVVAQDFFRRRDGGGERKVIDERAYEFRLGGPFFDGLGEVRVHWLSVKQKGKKEQWREAHWI